MHRNDLASVALITFAGLLSMIDRLACAMAGHERSAELYEFFEEAYHVERARLRLEAALQEAETPLKGLVGER